MVMLEIMQMMKGVCVVSFVGRVRRLLSFSTAKRTLAVWMWASSLIALLLSGGAGGAHLETASTALYFRLESSRCRSTT
jgi:hypothetical protein